MTGVRRGDGAAAGRPRLKKEPRALASCLRFARIEDVVFARRGDTDRSWCEDHSPPPRRAC